MKRILILILLLQPVFCYAEEVNWDSLRKISDTLTHCDQPIEKYNNLFDFSLSTATNCAECIEGISEYNEIAFLNCPEKFLLALKSSPLKTRNAVIYRFGVVHPPWELGPTLYKFKNHSILGEFVSKHFSELIKSGTNEDGTPIDPKVYWQNIKNQEKP